MMQVKVPEFAVVGHPDEGKSSVLSTLAEDDSIRLFNSWYLTASYRPNRSLEFFKALQNHKNIENKIFRKPLAALLGKVLLEISSVE